MSRDKSRRQELYTGVGARAGGKIWIQEPGREETRYVYKSRRQELYSVYRS